MPLDTRPIPPPTNWQVLHPNYTLVTGATLLSLPDDYDAAAAAGVLVSLYIPPSVNPVTGEVGITEMTATATPASFVPAGVDPTSGWSFTGVIRSASVRIWDNRARGQLASVTPGEASFFGFGYAGQGHVGDRDLFWKQTGVSIEDQIRPEFHMWTHIDTTYPFGELKASFTSIIGDVWIATSGPDTRLPTSEPPGYPGSENLHPPTWQMVWPRSGDDRAADVANPAYRPGNVGRVQWHRQHWDPPGRRYMVYGRKRHIYVTQDPPAAYREDEYTFCKIPGVNEDGTLQWAVWDEVKWDDAKWAD